MELIDSHCHLTFEQLAHDIEAVLARSRNEAVTSWISVGTDSRQNRNVIELAKEFEDVYAAVGIHPHHSSEVTAEEIAQLEQLARQKKVVAIGETGLDFHYNFSRQPDQKRIFVSQLNFAQQLNLPVIVHSREALEETVDILEQFGQGIRKIVFHCFTGTANQAKILLKKGFYISFTGVVTFKNAQLIRQAAEVVPLEKLMIETDCPYMSPEPVRKQEVNEPGLMIHTAKCLAQLKKMPLDEFAQAVTATTRNFFALPNI
jgi:TatD DNase family protein